jgi:hypothetical protein
MLGKDKTGSNKEESQREGSKLRATVEKKPGAAWILARRWHLDCLSLLIRAGK